MDNFTFVNPTRIVFGQGSVERIGNYLPASVQRILLTYGGGSVLTHGIYDAVVAQLAGRSVIPFGGIEANPDVTTLRRAIELGKREKVDFVLAVGGGSVIDGSKLIAAGLATDRDAWEIVLSGIARESLPLASVLTVPATGSEMNAGAVISYRERQEKFAFRGAYPLFSILDPTYAYTLSQHQIACGIADAFVHVCEQYLTFTGQSGIMDRMAEGVLLNLIDIANDSQGLSDRNYSTYCEYMLSATIALNGWLGLGVKQDWTTHMIGHEITALTGTTHGASLALIYPSLLQVLKAEKGDKIVQAGERLWGLHESDRETQISRTIEAFVGFFHTLGLPASLAEGEISKEVADEILRRVRERDAVYGEHLSYDAHTVERILTEALRP